MIEAHIDLHNNYLCYLECYSLQTASQIVRLFDIQNRLMNKQNRNNFCFSVEEIKIYDAQITYPMAQTS